MSQVRCGRAALLSGGDSLPSTNLVVDFNQNEGMDGIVFSPTYDAVACSEIALAAGDFVAGCA